ncbi:MAG: acetyl-CoA carboxylase biotin carboxyl carrier protein [Planctomycetes bacterium]|nr:acetyl-CoA carboxylase biotin carboxyl carrier protein [Planctomycetota bacterium]
MELPRVDLEQIRALMKLMEQFNFDEIDLREEGRRLHLSRGGRQRSGGGPVVVPTMVAPSLGGADAKPASAAPVAAASAADPGAGIKVIRSPMVGTFYRAPSPDSPNFVEEGAHLTEDSVLCIIEAMKVMNEIKAECQGELVKILVANGEAVEYGEPLFHVRVS